MYSEVAAERVDAEVEGLLEQAHRQAYTILTEYRMTLEQLAQALLQEEKLERDQVLAIISGTPIAQEGAGNGEGTKGKPIAGGGQ